eukprot:527706-Amphidinium_carterae.1
MEEGATSASSAAPVETPAKRPRGAVADLHSVAPCIKRPRNRADLSIEQQVVAAIADNISHYSPEQLDGMLVEGSERRVKTLTRKSC